MGRIELCGAAGVSLEARLRDATGAGLKVPAATLVLAMACAACGGSGESPGTPSPTPPQTSLTPVAASAEWPSALPDAEGFDTSRLTALVGRIRRGTYGAITSLLIVRNGRLVVEEYFNFTTAALPLTMQSVSKSVTSLLAGIAADQGRLGTDDQIVSRFHRYDPIAHLDSHKGSACCRGSADDEDGFRLG